MAKLTVHRFHPEIYPRYLFVVKGGTVQQIKQAFKDEDGDELLAVDDAYKCSKAAVWRVSYGEEKHLGVLVWITGKMGVKDIAHEACHVAAQVFLDCNVHWDGLNDEHFAYMTGWAADCINQVWTGKFKD